MRINSITDFGRLSASAWQQMRRLIMLAAAISGTIGTPTVVMVPS